MANAVTVFCIFAVAPIALMSLAGLPRLDIGVLSQAPPLHPNWTVMMNVLQWSFNG